MDRHTIQTVQRAVKRKARKTRFPATQDGERVIYCCKCLKASHEVEGIVYDPFISLCYECIENLAIFVGHLRDTKKETSIHEET